MYKMFHHNELVVLLVKNILTPAQNLHLIGL